MGNNITIRQFKNTLPIGGKMNQFYITTAIDYPNAKPHIGTAFEKIGADVQARYRRIRGNKVYFLMGTDENTVRVFQRAQSTGENVSVYVDRMAKEFQKVWDILNISYDKFIQTSSTQHHATVTYLIQKFYDKGLIYKKNFVGPYCEGCEEYKTPTSLQNDRCPNHPKEELRIVEEENYFFALSKFQEQLINLLEVKNGTSVIDVKPETRRNEVLNFIKEELRDISVTRKDQPWGISCPFDKDHKVYVWFDALLSYLTGVDYPNGIWPPDIQFIGKDIVRFHCALWPAILLAAEIPLPKKIYAHGFVHQKDAKGGKLVKSSKSGSAVNPLDLVNDYGVDAYRYYFLAKCPFNEDGEYDLERFIETYNSDLANTLGNLVSRVANLALRIKNGYLNATSAENVVWFDTEGLNKYAEFIENCQYSQALDVIWNILRKANAHMEKCRPWECTGLDLGKAVWVLRGLVAGLRIVSLLLGPFLPGTALKIYHSFSQPTTWETAQTWEYIQEVALDNYKGLRENLWVAGDGLVDDDKGSHYKPLFPRIKRVT